MEFLESIFQAGVVGCGGAGFPTHKKLDCRPEYLIINGAECEPLLRTDRYVMRNLAVGVVEAAKRTAREIGARECVIALKRAYTQEVRALEAAIGEERSVRLHLLDSFYPAGDEQTLVYEVTGRVVPPAGLPLEAGAVVQNVSTMLAVGQALRGEAFTGRYLTVTGEVKSPCIVYAPLGTPARECIALAGGAAVEDYILIAGGPMMGPVCGDIDNTFVTKTTSAYLLLKKSAHLAARHALTVRQMLTRARSACIQCSYCTELCPRYQLGHAIEPHRVMRTLAMHPDITTALDLPAIRNAALCCSCGICEEFACPMQLSPRRMNEMVKRALAEAKMRYTRPEGAAYAPRPSREYRKAPSKRVSARAGVLKYYHYEISDLRTAAPARVSLPLRQHIGAPSVPCVGVGDAVTQGMRIAACPEGALGANLHASISGTVTAVTKDAITIEAGGNADV